MGGIYGARGRKTIISLFITIFQVICCSISRSQWKRNSAEFGNVFCHPPRLPKTQDLAKWEMNLLEDISDPTDFEDASLRALDMAIRCPVCKEVVNNPAMTPCGHSFCSLVKPLHNGIFIEADIYLVYTLSSLCRAGMSILPRKMHRGPTQAEHHASRSCTSLQFCKVRGNDNSRRGYILIL
jgi:hypothetical protein